MDARAVLSVADEIEAAERDAVSEFVRFDGLDAVGAAYAAGGIDALDGGWAMQLRAACEAGGDARDLRDRLDMAAFGMSAISVRISDMLSALAQAVKAGKVDEFEERWVAADVDDKRGR